MRQARCFYNVGVQELVEWIVLWNSQQELGNTAPYLRYLQ